VLAEGQIEGGCLQAVGWATIEEIKMKDGGYQNDRLATYLIPRARTPAHSHDSGRETLLPWSLGRKGSASCPMDGPAPAFIAAIHDATGVWLDEVRPRRRKCWRHALYAERPRRLIRDRRSPPVDVLREDLGATGTKEGCGEGSAARAPC